MKKGAPLWVQYASACAVPHMMRKAAAQYVHCSAGILLPKGDLGSIPYGLHSTVRAKGSFIFEDPSGYAVSYLFKGKFSRDSGDGSNLVGVAFAQIGLYGIQQSESFEKCHFRRV